MPDVVVRRRVPKPPPVQAPSDKDVDALRHALTTALIDGSTAPLRVPAVFRLLDREQLVAILVAEANRTEGWDDVPL